MPSIQFSATLVGVAIITAIIIIAPLLTVPDYSVVSHPISMLGAQATPNAWLMNIGLAALGLGPAVDALRRARAQWIRTIFFLIFSAAMVAAAVFSTRPVNPDIVFDTREEVHHAIAAMVAGYSFSIGAVIFAITQKVTWHRLASLFAAAAASFIPMLMFKYPEVMGLLQRFMLATCFLWLIVFLPVSDRSPLKIARPVSGQ
jgi:hypothetical membrane protein